MSAETVTAYWTAIGLGLVMAASFLLGRWRGLGWLSPPLIALALTAFLVNVGWMPDSENNPVYGFVTGPGLLVAIFLLLLQVDLGVFQRAGPRMVMLFFAGGAAISAGIAATLFIPWIGATLGAEYPTLSGMYAATYIGGSVNFNATAAVSALKDRATHSPLPLPQTMRWALYGSLCRFCSRRFCSAFCPPAHGVNLPIFPLRPLPNR